MMLIDGLVRLRYKLKKRQVKMLKRFANMMKWPNLAETMDNLRQKDQDLTLDTVSSDAFAFLITNPFLTAYLPVPHDEHAHRYGSGSGH
jgi:hypothetical protein